MKKDTADIPFENKYQPSGISPKESNLADVQPVQSDEEHSGDNSGIIPDVFDAGAWLDKKYPPPEQILSGLLDKGSKALLIGNSKSRKSFFLLQLAVSLAAGNHSFLSWSIPQKRRVLLLQLEIQESHFHRRLVNMCKATEINGENITGFLHVMNGRGFNGSEVLGNSLLAEHIIKNEIDVLIVDPFYKVLEGDENKAEDVKPVLSRFDKICEETGAAVVFAHHNPKGQAGDRNRIDRGAGSGILARDYDAAIYLTEHSEDDLQVLETVVRNYPPCDPFSVTWKSGIVVIDDTPPSVRTSRNGGQRGRKPKPKPSDEMVKQLVESAPLPKNTLKNLVIEKFGMAHNQWPGLIQGWLHDGVLTEFGKQGRVKMVGLPHDIEKLKKDQAQSSLKFSKNGT